MEPPLEPEIARLSDGWPERLLRALRDHRERPRFSASWVSLQPPPEASLVREYPVNGSAVRLYRIPGGTESLYFVAPGEYALPSPHVRLVHLAKEAIQRATPGRVRLDRPEDVREYVRTFAERAIPRLAAERSVSLGADRAEEVATVRRLAAVLATYTAGLGVVEIPLRDPNVQDVYLDAPAGATPLHVTIADLGGGLHQRCVTNIHLTPPDAEALLARFRLESGRPFSEAMPVLETNLDAFRVRATAVGPPLSPDGLAVALRRHSTDPWTLPRLIAAGALTPLAAGLLSFLIDGRSTILIAGARGAGKSSLLGALLFEFPRSQRILTIEDTRELPTAYLQSCGYKVQSLFVRSSLGGTEMSADEALRVSLRLGESALVLGEVRGQEARTLYEAMRAGTAGSAVLGTIHGNSSRAVYERIVHDMGIPPTSFGATDVVLVAGLVRPGGVQRSRRRVLEVTEVAKTRGPGEFAPLLAYDPSGDALLEAPAYGASERVRAIAESWSLPFDEAMENIRVRAAIREALVEQSSDRPDLLSASWVARANAAYWTLVEEGASGGDVLPRWRDWFRGALRA
ncbi:MAG TPA: type II/IV secretion system ATPase subunit [Thermoplasmata archaeon]|nr:type II/IV secretion system ATPase subunit [Thermoplasmata archaeon]